jgi:hypothetical protein
MVMPLIFDIEFQNGDSRRLEVPVEVWRYEDEVVKIPFLSEEEVVRISLDRDNAFADANLKNNQFPPEIEEGRFLLKEKKKPLNPMRLELYPAEDKEDSGEKED